METLTTPPQGTPAPADPLLVPTIHPLPAVVKTLGALFLTGATGALTGDTWLVFFVLAGYPAIWAVCDTLYPTHHKRAPRRCK